MDFFDVVDVFRRRQSKRKAAMLDSLVSDAAWYLFESGGNVEYFHRVRKGGAQRLGQAFCNALTDQDRLRLLGSDFDPYFDDAALPAAIKFLSH